MKKSTVPTSTKKSPLNVSELPVQKKASPEVDLIKLTLDEVKVLQSKLGLITAMASEAYKFNAVVKELKVMLNLSANKIISDNGGDINKNWIPDLENGQLKLRK